MSKSTVNKGDESRLDKFKHFFGLGSHRVPASSTNIQRTPLETIFTPETLKDIGPKSPANHRMKTIRELTEIVKTKRLEENAVEALWHCVSDLLEPKASTQDRHLALRFLTALIAGQYDQLGVMRAHFFRVIKNHTLFEDLPQRLEMFQVLSADGKNLEYFEEETGVFLHEWMKDIMSSSKLSDFLGLLVNVIKYNAAYLDEDVVASLVLDTTLIANRTSREENIELCLKVLDTIIAYSCLPSQSLHQFTACLCRIVNVQQLCQSSWMLMRKLLGTHLGHRGIFTMCCILQDKSNKTESGAALLRGAVFFIGMALWGSKKVTSLKHPPSSVLPSFIQALQHSDSSPVAYEVGLSVQRLVNKYGKDQQMITWDLILDIIDALLRHIENVPASTPLVVGPTHNLLTAVEELYDQGQFNGSHSRLFAIIESCAAKRPEASILSLVQYKAQSVRPSHSGWVQNLNHLVEKYFRQESRSRIRWKVLDVLSSVISENRQLYEDELVEMVVLPHLSHIEHDPDLEVRQRAAQLLVDLLASCSTLRGLDLLDLVQKVLNRPLSLSTPASPTPSPALTMATSITGSVDATPELPRRMFDPRLDDVNTAVLGLITIFKVKLFHLPSSHPLRIYELLVKHVQAHYQSDHMLHRAGTIRKSIFELLLALRADGLYRLGLPTSDDDHTPVYSPHVLCAYSGFLPDALTKGVPGHAQFSESRPEMSERHLMMSDVTSSPPPSSSSSSVRSSPSVSHFRITIVPYAQTFTAIKDCLELETDWNVLKVVLEQLPHLLQNKTLILAALPEDLDRFCARLCAMVSNRALALPERLANKPAQFTKSDFHSYIFPVLTCLVSYHLDRARQVDLVRCLEFGLVSKCARACVRALTVCALEMADVMMRQLPSILLKLSQISATMAMAIPLMEFLSSLIRVPQLYTNFVEEQYMSVFAIALPYTNPFKYTHYTVSLAYHVIAMWFLKCKLPFRKRFVGFIVKGLRANVLRQFEESVTQRARVNMDSADRHRTQSLNDEAIRRKAAAARAAAAAKTQGSAPAAEDESMMQFHKELMETCIDVMARYTFSNCASMPKRTPFSEFLLEGGQSQSWLLGNKIITITTSGGAGVTKSGLCDKCLLLARAAARDKSEATRSASEQSLSATRKRHRSAAVRSKSETVALKPLSQDDLHLHRHSPREGQSDAYRAGVDGSFSSSPAGGAEVPPGAGGVESVEDKMQLVDNVLMGLKANPTDKSIFTKQQCNCWCTLWAEVHVRRPTGNVSWMLRIQNEQDLVASFPDFPLADMSSLFLNPPDECYDYMTRRKIDSMTLGETEYEGLLEEHFERDSLDDSQKEKEAEEKDNASGGGASGENDETDETTGTEPAAKTEASFLRKSTSSPELTPQDQQQPSADMPGNVRVDLVADSLSKHQDVQPLVNGEEKNGHVEADKDGESVLPATITPVATTTGTVPTTPDVASASERSRPIDIPKADLPSTRSMARTVDIPEDVTDGLVRRQRSHTTAVPPERERRKVSVIEPPSMMQRKSTGMEPLGGSSSSGGSGKDGQAHGGMSPSFIFLQLYHSNLLGAGDQRPVLLPNDNQVIDRAVKMLDLMFPYETHKIGVLYVCKGQEADQQGILSNKFGSSRYAEFLQGLGDLIRLADCNQQFTYVGGLHLHGQDGQFAYAWHDDFMQVIFHVATLMPTKDSDPNCNAKKLHIGNDYVTIVYNESGREYKIGTIKGQFNYVNIIVQPLDHGSNAVIVQTRDDIMDIIGHTDVKIISDVHLSKLVRQMAIHANLASMILQRQKTNPRDPFASNWLERLRKIRHIHARVQSETSKDKDRSKEKDRGSPMTEDFTDFV